MENIKFDCKLETVDKSEVALSLFKVLEKQQEDDVNNEFLMHLSAEVADQGEAKVQSAEFIVIVDRSGSMQGTPWKQVQGGLTKMLELTRSQENIRIRVISYNQEASQVALTGESQVDKASIDKIRASGSTSFVAVFKHLSAIFKDKTEDASKAFFVFFMTDGEDTVSSPKEIMQQKELMQTDIEKFGAEVVFHVLGFSEQHDEQFLESLTFLGTSDGTYSFVSPSEGGKAIEERLIALVQSTSSAVGRSLNIEMKSNDLQFLGDTFGEGKAEVVVPAMVSKNNGVVRIATKKFVKKMPTCKGSPKLELKIYEKLTGAPDAISASIAKTEEFVLKEQVHVADHNLVKLRTALNMITGQISEADKPEQVEGMKVWHKLVQEKFAKITLDESIPQNIKSKKKAVESGIAICRGIYEESKGMNDRERGLRMQAMSTTYQMSSNQVQNRRQVRSKETSSNKWMAKKTSRSVQQQIQTTADYSAEDFVMIDNQKK